MTTTGATPVANAATIVSLPPATVALLNPDGSLSQPWRRFFQQLWLRTGGAGDGLFNAKAILEALAFQGGYASSSNLDALRGEVAMLRLLLLSRASHRDDTEGRVQQLEAMVYGGLWHSH